MMNKLKIKQAIRDIGIALNLVNNTIATDDVNAQPSETSWQVDNSKEIDQLKELERLLLNDTDTCPLCNHCNEFP